MIAFLLAVCGAIAWAATTLFRALAGLAAFALRHPALLLAATAAGLTAWLLAPLLGVLAGSSWPVYLLGGAGTLVGGTVIGRALLDDRRYEAGIRAREAAERAAGAAPGPDPHTAQPVPAGGQWWKEYL